MRISVRLIVSLIAGVTLVTIVSAYFQVQDEMRRTRDDLVRRTQVLAESLEETIVPLMHERSERHLRQLVERFGNRERLAGIAVYDKDGNIIAASTGLDKEFQNGLPGVAQARTKSAVVSQFLMLGRSYMHLYVLPLRQDSEVVGSLAVLHDASYIQAQSSWLWRVTFFRVLMHVGLIVLVTLLIVRWSLVGPIARTAQWMRELRTGSLFRRPGLPEADLFKPLAQEVTQLVKSLETARAAAEEEARLREASESLWTAERLRVSIQNKLLGSLLFVVSNREPYEHVRKGDVIESVVPASGLVTALEPVLRACNGTWIAHGSGDADREMVDQHDRLRLPPEQPGYTLRRVWLSKEEEEGYYYGFSNEGLWPLCHIAHTRPIFRASDWEFYQQANRKFAQAVLEEMASSDRSMLLVQDYHFALLPQLAKEMRPDTRIAIFWHIPWPNPEAFGICPWQRELLNGLLGADLVGFHIQAHCNNFLETVDRTLEAQVDWERFAVRRRGHFTLVRPFPISVHFTDCGGGAPGERPSPYVERAALLKELGVSASFMGIGVDRVDYTKGILERFRGIERFFDKWPTYRGKFAFVQIGAPSRTHIKRYHDLLAEVGAEAERINWRFQTRKWKPIVLLTRHHSHKEIERYFRAADVCIVTSLHDGMNLVAKEFVAAREDEQGALILSRFTGASHELRDALVVNPYDTEQLADAIHLGLEMDPEERRARMQRMREVLREHNVYRWAAHLVSELSEIRVDGPDRS